MQGKIFKRDNLASQAVMKLDGVALREHNSVPTGWVIFPVGARVVFAAGE